MHQLTTACLTADITSTDRGYLSICLAVRNQAEDVREWALHHLGLGATKIYIFEHNSSSPALAAVQDLVDAGEVPAEASWSGTM
jgi:hypothetical protein